MTIITCSECKKVLSSTDEMVLFNERWICLNCKNIIIQKLKAGMSLEPDSTNPWGIKRFLVSSLPSIPFCVILVRLFGFPLLILLFPAFISVLLVILRVNWDQREVSSLENPWSISRFITLTVLSVILGVLLFPFTLYMSLFLPYIATLAMFSCRLRWDTNEKVKLLVERSDPKEIREIPKKSMKK